MLDTSFLTLFLAGFLGGGHCFGMCGGIVAALTLNQKSGRQRWNILLGYNLGRLLSYMTIGALLGGLAATFPQAQATQKLLYCLANLMIMAIGLYLAGISTAISLVEKIGQPLWRWMNPWVRGLIPVKNSAQAVLAGALWGWVPCGLVYSASLSALASGSASRGATSMLCFALGTLPNLLAMGAFADEMKKNFQKKSIRQMAGWTVVVMGAYPLATMLLNSL
jgi:hypothetical protein